MRPISSSGSATLTLPDSRSTLRQLAGVRWGLLTAALLLSAIGLATIHSASSELALDYLPRQAAWVLLGLLAASAAFSLDYRLFLTLAPSLYVLTLGLLGLVLWLGQEAGGARSWLGIGGIRGQPSELAKVATVLLLARYMAKVNRPFLRLTHVLVASLITAAPVLLIALEPDMGSAAMFLPILAGMLLVAGVERRVLVLGLVLALLLGVLGWHFVMLDYQKQRVFSFLSPESDPLGSGYQLRQSKIAVGSGALLGRGYMQGTQSQLRFLPARHTDFIFAVLAEEWGFLGVVSALALFALYFWNGSLVAARARDRAGVLLVVGLLSGLGFHVLYNTAMVVGLLPITGVPIPFLSYGGSFALATFIATGLILGVDFRRHVNR